MRRKILITQAYTKIAETQGNVNVESLGKAYKAHKHPDVIIPLKQFWILIHSLKLQHILIKVVRGSKSAKAHFDEFLKEWNIKDLQRPIS